MEVSLEREFQELRLSDKRKKLDDMKVLGIMNSFNIENGASVNEEKEHESSVSKCDLRKSLAWDSAFFTSPGVLDPDELLQTVNSWGWDNENNVMGQREQVYLPSDSMERERTSRIGNSNLRRSLAWDNAFFTNAGVLDPYELSMINQGYRKSGFRGLPGIAELQQSVESSTTIDSDSFSLESIEYDLFGGVRTSTQNSSTNSSVSSLNCRVGRKTASKKSDQSSQSSIKIKPVSGRQSANVNGVETTRKDAHVHPRAQRATSLSLKPPRILRRSNPILAPPAKRDALGAKHVKMESKTANASNGKHLSESKRPCLGYSRIVPTSAPYSKSTLRSINESSCNELADARSNSACTTPSNSLRKTFDSQCTRRKRPAMRDDSQPTYLQPTPKACSCKSLAKSVDILPLKSSTACDAASQASDSGCCLHNKQGVTLHNQCVKKSPMGSKLISPHASLELKPSGLRMPSPKIGFFDENSIVESLNGDLETHGCGEDNVPEFRTPISDNKIKTAAKGARYSKNRSAGNSARTGNMERGSQQAGFLSPASGIWSSYLEQLEEKRVSPQLSSLSRPMRKRIARSHNDLAGKLSGKEGLRLERMGTRHLNVSERALGSGLKSKGERRHGLCDSNLCAEVKGQLCLRGGKHPENNLQISGKSSDKENIFSFGDHVRGLSDQLGVIDISPNIVIE